MSHNELKVLERYQNLEKEYGECKEQSKRKKSRKLEAEMSSIRITLDILGLKINGIN